MHFRVPSEPKSKLVVLIYAKDSIANFQIWIYEKYLRKPCYASKQGNCKTADQIDIPTKMIEKIDDLASYNLMILASYKVDELVVILYSRKNNWSTTASNFFLLSFIESLR